MSKVKVALLSISCMSDIQGIDKNVSHSPTVKHIKCTGTTTDKTRDLDTYRYKKHTDTRTAAAAYVFL